MRGCERAGPAPRAPPAPPPGPAAPAGDAPPGAPLSAHAAPHAPPPLPATCPRAAPYKQHGEHTPASHTGTGPSLAQRTLYVPLPRNRRKDRGRRVQPPGGRQPARALGACGATSSPAHLRPEYCLLRQDTIITRNRGENYSEEATLARSGTSRSCSSNSDTRVARSRAGAACGLLALLLLASCRSGCAAGAGGAGGALGAGVVCARAAGLTERQRALCRAMPAAMPAIAAGLRMAYAECRAQLAGRRWNCSGVGDHNHFAHVVPLATREAAYTYALTSAGVTHALSALCARGDLPACGCQHRRRAEWEAGAARETGAGRCGDVAYGARLARRFLDARELERDPRALMNLHNNRLGRKMVKELVRVECKCHGVSGSCAVRTCWRALPPFRSVARALTDKYARARMVLPVQRGVTPDGHANIQLLVNRSRAGGAAGAGGARAARRSELVFLAASPSYCEPDPAAAAPGTHGRRCNHTSPGPGGCGALCCSRGHSAVRAVERVQCRCSFHWCCRVTCDTCLLAADYHVCN